MTDRASTSADRTLEKIMVDVDELKRAAVEHRVRLENGTKVFGGWSERIQAIEERTTPKPPSITKIVGITLSIILASSGALWGLANMLRDRPTVQQIREVVKSHDANGHKDMKGNVRSVQLEQGAQRVIIEDVSRKVDALLERTPSKRRRRR